MKIVIASDSFKGSLSSAEVAKAAREGILGILPNAQVICVNVADGGEGTVEAVTYPLGGQIKSAIVRGPMPVGPAAEVSAQYGLAGDTAVVEVASASGLPLVPQELRNPELSSTLGTGQLIAHAIRSGARNFLVGIGGSATNDAGTGMLQALGYRFLDADGNELDGIGANLGRIERIDDSGLIEDLKACSFAVACDVDTPFCGPKGAAYVFAPQKGADAQMVSRLDRGMAHFADVVASYTGTDLRDMAGTGAAGGLGLALTAFLGARLEKGIDLVLSTIGFDSIIADADLIITGEGCMDSQTPLGKTAAGVLRRAKGKVPVAAICGGLRDCPELRAMGFSSITCITPAGMPLAQAMDPGTASANVRRAVAGIISPGRQE